MMTAPGARFRYCTSMLVTVMVPAFSVPSTFAITSFVCGLEGSTRSARFLRAADALVLPAVSSLYTVPETSIAKEAVVLVASQALAFFCWS